MGSLADVLPSVAASLGVSTRSGFDFPSASRAVVVLVDGLGYELLIRRQGHAPFLRSLRNGTQAVSSGFPSTTATSMATFGTGLDVGVHGLVGYDAYDPDRGQVFNELSWHDGPLPETWQPHPTVFEAAQAAAVPVTRIGPALFDGSGLTRAALRGGRFVAADTGEARIQAAVTAAVATERALIYLYWGDLDKAGHVHGCDSWQWGDELSRVDGVLAALARRLPGDCSLTITADHGMIDCPLDLRLDVAASPALCRGVRLIAGEPRSLQLHCEAGEVDAVTARWRGILQERADVLTRRQAIDGGLFGTVSDGVAKRIGDVVVICRDRFAIEDSRIHRRQMRELIGLHGGTTPDEMTIPVIHRPAGSGALS